MTNPKLATVATMTKSEKQLRRGLHIALRFYQHPVSEATLKRYRVEFSVWKNLVKHGCLEQTPDKLVTLSDRGLAQAKRLFPLLADDLSTLKRVPSMVAIIGYVFVSRIEVDGQNVTTYYFDEQGHETTDDDQRLFISEDDWRTKKDFERDFKVAATRSSKLVPNKMVDTFEDEEPPVVDYSDWLK